MKQYIIILFAIVLAACGKDHEAPEAPGKVILITPDQNTVCKNGTVITDSTASLQFVWTRAIHADSYVLTVQNMQTKQTTTLTALDSTATVTLLRNTPYAWWVTSQTGYSDVTTQSDTWKFYIAAPAAITYPPFPATIVTPLFGANITAVNNKIDLEWSGADTDNDIAGYDVYIGTTAALTLLQSNVKDMFIKGVTVNAGTRYFWKVITHDSEGNTADSGLFQFNVN